MNALSAKNQLASNSALQMPKLHLQSSVRPRPAPKQQQHQLQQVQQQQQQQQLLQAVIMPEPVLQSCASISQPVRPATSQTSEAAHRLYMQVSIGEFLPEFFFPVF